MDFLLIKSIEIVLRSSVCEFESVFTVCTRGQS